MQAYDFPNHATSPPRARHVITVGGGNVAMDAARSALRLGSRSTIVYRRSRQEMPARAEEVHHAEQEGMVFHLLANPIRILTDKFNRVTGMECLQMELGTPDESGRRRPVPVEGSNFVLDADAIVIAIGNRPNPLIPQTSPDLRTSKHGTVVVDQETMKTSCPGVFAGGDVVSGAATVISALGQGKLAARSIQQYLLSAVTKVAAPSQVERGSELADSEAIERENMGLMTGAAAAPAMAVHLQWSPWCPSRLFCRKPQNPRDADEGIPDIPGICVVGRAKGRGDGFSIMHVQATYNLAQAFDRLFALGSPIYSQLQQGQCFLRWAPIAQRTVRDHVLATIQGWIAADAPANSKPALIEELLLPTILPANEDLEEKFVPDRQLIFRL
jgi:hypothetical protein